MELDDFRSGDARGTETSDAKGGCCGKPFGCNIVSDGCLHPKDKADWQALAQQQAERERTAS